MLLQEHAPSRVIVLLDQNKVFPMSEKDMGIQLTGTVGTQGAFLYKITDNSTVERKVEQLKSMAGVLSNQSICKGAHEAGLAMGGSVVLACSAVVQCDQCCLTSIWVGPIRGLLPNDRRITL